jgi:hypothetical protein
MRKSLSLAVAVATLSTGTLAFAQAAIDPYDDAAAAPAPPPAAVAPIAPIAPAAPPAGQLIDPYNVYPAPPAYGYQPPSAGPAVVPSPPQYQQGYYLYAAPGQPPVYYAPPPAVYRPACSAYCGCAHACCAYSTCAPRRVIRRWDGVRRFSLGAHASFLTLNQQVGSSAVTLGGAGFQLRMRSSGRFGFEMAQDFLHASYWNGAFQRDSFPFSMSLMFYIFPNSDARHFNLYGLAGVGIMSDVMTLRDENNLQVQQNFTEYTAHAGVGAELRFRWFGIEADARYLGLWRDNNTAPATYYGNVAGAPIPKSSQGVQGNLYLSLWF